ncbi:E3 ubiquitin-protein ligase HERC1 [Phytophthora cinnamomi]|uniref:E3 ubiquitin-protein ligase HERC1 n=1 Tax=Phytophthora cinnamomi TaxID=4785 RepID=UPI00355A440B|nr:E3 ubiquitin-protein ligase HERC1 [Phytophthora cinnamomi]
MEALRLQDAAYVSARYEELQELKRQQEQRHVKVAADERAPCYAPNRELSAEQRQELEQWRIVERAAALDAQGPTPRWKKKFSVLASVLESLYAENGADPSVTSPSKMALSRPETGDGACSPVPLKELPLPTQVALKMFFRTCQSLRDPAKLAANSRLSVQIASKLPAILTTMPPCVLSPGLVDDTSVDLEDGSNVSSVFYQLFRLFEELLGVTDDEMGDSNSAGGGDRPRSCLSTQDGLQYILPYSYARIQS